VPQQIGHRFDVHTGLKPGASSADASPH